MPAGRGQLDWSANVNWVEKEGGLPKDIEDLAVELVKKGMDRSRAIATAVSRAKHWAAVSKDAKTRAKWSKAVAEWEKLKAKAHARPNKGITVKASATEESDVLVLSNGAYNTDVVTKAFDEQQRQYRVAYSQRNAFSGDSADIPQLMLKELWTDSVIAYDPGEDQLYKVNYVVTPDRKVYFGDPVKVRLEYVPDEGMMGMDDTEGAGDTTDWNQGQMGSGDMGDMMKASNTALGKIMALTETNSALAKILRG